MSLDGIFDPVVRACFAKHGGGSNGEIVGYQYGTLLPDINTVWTDKIKKILPYAFICRSGVDFNLCICNQPLRCDNSNAKFYFPYDTVGLLYSWEKKTNTWYGQEYDPNWETADDIDQYVGYAGDTLDDINWVLVWHSEDISYESWGVTFTIPFADPVTVYSDGTGKA